MFGFGPRVTSVTPAELESQVAEGKKLTIIDVREPWEYAEGHIPGSQLRPLGQIRDWVSQFDKQAEIHLICRTASRSAQAYRFMETMGFKNLRNVSGGMVAWRGPVAR
ncbi:MAG TPA: rhodanese-like domain-containing protein [Symbiobacteriaceae bacterium]|nr:rhodanese-like domain-containing protein [Symbiobacteriaceae bacterium]